MENHLYPDVFRLVSITVTRLFVIAHSGHLLIKSETFWELKLFIQSTVLVSSKIHMFQFGERDKPHEKNLLNREN